VYRIVAALPADLVTLAHDGTKAYSNAFELVHRREADGPNAIWQADHTPLDILLIRPDHWRQLPTTESPAHSNRTNSRNQRPTTSDENRGGSRPREPGDWA